MIGILVSGHGNFASGLTTALELLAGPQEAYQAVDFLPEHSADELKEKMQKAVAELGACDSVLILTDLTGGTPYNVASKLRLEQMEASKAPALEVIGGANLGGVMDDTPAGLQREGTGSFRVQSCKGAGGSFPDRRGGCEGGSCKDCETHASCESGGIEGRDCSRKSG